MIRTLIIVNVLIFILGNIPVGHAPDGSSVPVEYFLQKFGALWPLGSQYFMPWQYFSYMFLHGGLGHIFFNMLTLWMFGMELEQMWGSKRFLTFYLICGLGAGIIHSIVTLLMHGGGPTIGASGAVMGVAVAFGMIFPDRILYVNFFFPMKAKFAVLFFVAIDLFMGIRGSDNVAHFAHLGGALIGFLLVKIGGPMTLGGIFDRLPGRRQPHQPPSAFQQPRPHVVDVEYRDVKAEPARRQAPTTMNFGDDQERIDAILDKISRQGYQSLTEEEKAMLNDASRRMR